MPPSELIASRLRRRQAWLLAVVVIALAASAVFAAMATGSFDTSRTSAEPTVEVGPPARTAIEAEPPTLPRSVPVRLRIPTIGVDSDLLELGLQKDGALEVPPGAFPAGWFNGAPTPGELGPAIIAGHVRFGTPGVFARLTELKSDDEIEVTREDESTAVFVVTGVEHFAKSGFPSARVYGDIDHAGLRLITCGGLNAATNEFDENVVVFAELASAQRKGQTP